MFSGVSIQIFACLTGGLVSRLLPGWEAALNHHTAFVHFPIAFWLAALFFEAIALWRRNNTVHRTAVWLLWLGTISGTVAVVTGLRAAGQVPSGVGGVLEIHRDLMLASYCLALGLSSLAFFARRRTTGLLMSGLLGGLFILSVLMLLGTDRGGEMVGRYGFGVDGSVRRAPASKIAANPAVGAANLKYVGSKSCQPCHASIYARWKRTPMANVVRDPREHRDAVLADFSNRLPS